MKALNGCFSEGRRTTPGQSRVGFQGDVWHRDRRPETFSPIFQGPAKLCRPQIPVMVLKSQHKADYVPSCQGAARAKDFARTRRYIQSRQGVMIEVGSQESSLKSKASPKVKGKNTMIRQAAKNSGLLPRNLRVSSRLSSRWKNRLPGEECHDPAQGPVIPAQLGVAVCARQGKSLKALPVFRAVGVGYFAVSCFSATTYDGRLAILFTGRKLLRSSDLR